MSDAPTEFDPIDVSSTGFWSGSASHREQAFAALRVRPQLSWHPPAAGGLMEPEGAGFWAVVTHADITRVSRDPKRFSSGCGVMLEDVPAEIEEAATSFLAMDAPRHTLLRRLVSSAFTPRQVARIDGQIRGQAVRIVDDLLEHDECDFVAEVGARLPLWTIAELVGVDADDRDAYAEVANAMVGWNDPTIQAGREPTAVLFEALLALHGLADTMAEQRRRRPREDLMTALVEAEVEGERLTQAEIAAFFVLLAVAGNDTTRNTISLGMKALCEHPDQRARLAADLDGGIDVAVEELVRWVSPVMTFRRTATEEVLLGERTIVPGERVVLFYASGNRDEAVFERSGAFDVARSHNPHVGFGGGGPHFCLGASLARTQLRAMFTELLRRTPALELGEPDRLVSNFVDTVRALPCRVAG